MTAPTRKELFEALKAKSTLKQEVYHKTAEVFETFKKAAEALPTQFHKEHHSPAYPVLFEYRIRGQFEFELKFGGDILIFMMHTNVFEFNRDHEVMRTSYIKEDISRSYCGIIQIFNFLNDSFKYNRVNDAGYMIGRVFVNRELHYFIEGKREIGLLYNNFNTSVMTTEAVGSILRSAMLYTINFDLLTPDFNDVKEVTVAEMQDTIDRMTIRTGKRLGYRFQADRANGEEGK